MSTWKAEIKLKSRLVTPLFGDTLFGHIVWGIARHMGEEAVTHFLDEFEATPFVVSSAFPHDFLPKPLLIQELPENIPYQDIKNLKKIRYIPASLVLKGEPITYEKILEGNKQNNIEFNEFYRMHNTCNRLEGGTVEGTGLYEIEETWYCSSQSYPLFDFYIVSQISESEIKKYLTWAFEAGYGADASTGAGNIELATLKQVSFPEIGSRAMALGPFCVLKDSYTRLDLLADVFVRRGKLGVEFSQYMNPFKKPIVFYTEGSTFNWDSNRPCYIGALLKNIHRDPRIVQQAAAPLVYINEGRI